MLDRYTKSPRIHSDIGGRLHDGGRSWSVGEQTLSSTEAWAWCDIFSDEECDSITAIASGLGLRKGLTKEKEGQSKRVSDIRFLYPNPATYWVFDRLTDAIRTLNEDFFKFDITYLHEGAQFTRYEAPHGNYEWHVDHGLDIPIRKLSATVQLTEPATYEGGNLEINESGEVECLPRKRGRMIIFPSWTLHRVTPVTSGIRDSLVVWVSGPPFK